MKNLIVHVGAHKTGSTFLQNTMKNNLKLLRENAVGYFGGEDARVNFTRNIVYPAVGLRESAQTRGDFVSQARSLLEEKAGDTTSLFLSNENVLGYCDLTLNEGLIYPKAKSVFEFISELSGDWNVKIVYFIRGYSDFIESTYVQKIKEGFSYTFEKYKRLCHPEKISWVESVDAARALFGEDNVTLVKYEDFRNDQIEILDKVLSTLPDSPIELEVDAGKTVNPSYSNIALELARMANSVLRKTDLKDYRNFLTRRFPVSEYGRVSLLTDEERAMFHKKYQEDCHYLKV